jgi:hypothetical protein
MEGPFKTSRHFTKLTVEGILIYIYLELRIKNMFIKGNIPLKASVLFGDKTDNNFRSLDLEFRLTRTEF